MKLTHELVSNTFDVSELKKQVLSIYDEFDRYEYRRTAPGSPHSEMTDIWVRFNDIAPFLEEGSLEKIGDEHDSIWYEVADKIPAVRKVAFDLMHKVDGERLGGILITKLPPGGKIDRHRDMGWHAQYYEKFFVPIQIKKEAVFGFDDGEIHAVEGDVWWFDNSNDHWVTNETDCDRIAMIVCIRTDKYKDHHAYRI